MNAPRREAPLTPLPARGGIRLSGAGRTLKALADRDQTLPQLRGCAGGGSDSGLAPLCGIMCSTWKVAPWRLSCIRQYWHRPPVRARTVRDSSSGTLIMAACRESAMPRRGRATVARSIQPMPPALPFQIPAKALRCCGPLVPEDDGPSSTENADFQQPLSNQPVRQLLNSRDHLKTPRHRCQRRVKSQREKPCRFRSRRSASGRGIPSPRSNSSIP